MKKVFNNSDDYHIYSSAKKLHLYIIKYLSSKIPKVYANLRVSLNDECNSLIKNIYASYLTDGSIRKKYINLSCVSISVIISISKLLADVKISLFAWRNKVINEK